ncbi:hypothetical protein GDO81_020414 [Engystomops pustulosus]|uniref:Uncharacterized protein n=1 Tax=Engystomops pustulosus TaxID=76066 RepID=A0AAV6Z9U2_ENGPU|nr:hypothetical protein GDO81_020414 [Engystomops pustulosus]
MSLDGPCASGPISDTISRLFPFIKPHQLLVATTLPVEHGNVFNCAVINIFLFIIIIYLLFYFSMPVNIALHKVDYARTTFMCTEKLGKFFGFYRFLFTGLKRASYNECFFSSCMLSCGSVIARYIRNIASFCGTNALIILCAISKRVSKTVGSP